MLEQQSSFNPACLTDQLTKDYYAWGGRQLSRERNELIAWLRKKYKDDQAAIVLAAKLERCKPQARCKSQACPECSHAAVNLITEVVSQHLKAKSGWLRPRIACISIVPADGTIAPGQLSPGQHQRNTRRWKEKLGRAGVTAFIGASDWSANEHLQARYEPHWAHHFYGFTVVPNVSALDTLKFRGVPVVRAASHRPGRKGSPARGLASIPVPHTWGSALTQHPHS
jgi:hypothetical protein